MLSALPRTSVRMGEHCLPKQLLVSALVGGRRAPGGQKLCWNDLLYRDLKACSLQHNWREMAQNRDAWHNEVKEAIRVINQSAEHDEKVRKDLQKKRRELRMTSSNNCLKCSHSGCPFSAISAAGLTNHVRQKHSQCTQCLNVQGLHMHLKFCPERPPY